MASSMAYSNNLFFQNVTYMNGSTFESLHPPTIMFGDQVSPGFSSDTQSSSTTTGGMSPDTTMQEDIPEYCSTDEPYLKITEEPYEEFRFRYQSEMQGAHGAILGKSSDKHRKTYPSVMLYNYKEPAIIRCTLATASGHRSVHAHRLVAKLQEGEKDDPHDIEVGPDGFEAVFQNMVIIHIEKKKVVKVLEEKIKNLIAYRFPNSVIELPKEREKEIKENAKQQANTMDMNQVSLKFEALRKNDKNQLVDICPPVFTGPINNLKSHLRGKLKICRIDKHIGSCRGEDEVFIFVEKVAKKNIKVQFFELDDEKKEIWCDDAKFTENDVHHQYGIAFRTPPYKTPDISRNAHVYVRLYRPSDGGVSDPLEFQYKPVFAMGKRNASSNLPLTLSKRPLLEQNVPIPSPGRSPDTTVFDTCSLVQNCLENSIDDFDMSFVNNIIGEDDFSNISLSSNPSLNDVLQGLPTPVSEEFRKCLSDLSSSGDFDEYKKIVLADDDMITTDAVQQKEKRTSKIGKPNSNTKSCLKKTITKDDYISRGIQVLNKMLLCKKRSIIDKPKLTQFIKNYFTYSLDTKNNSVLHMAIHRGMGNSFSLLNSYLDFITQNGEENKTELINFQNLDEETPLHIAVKEGLADAVTKLVSTGLAHLNLKDNNNKSPLHYAVLFAESNVRGLEILQTLIDSPSCDVNEICDDGTPLHLATREKKNSRILNILLKHPEINVNKVGGSSRETVLHIAVESLNISTVKNLVLKCKEYGKELKKDIKNSSEETPLTLCAKLELNEDPKIRSKAEEIALFLSQTEDSLVTTVENMNPTMEDVKPSKTCLKNVSEQHYEESKLDKIEPKSSSADKKTARTLYMDMPAPLVNIKTEENATILGYNEETGLFDKKALKELKALLDKDEAWVELALLLGYKKLLDKFRDIESPTVFLLTYVESIGMESNIVNIIYDHLIAANLTQAAKVVEEMISRKKNKEKITSS